MSNRSEGAKFERELADLFFKKGCWVHLLQQNSAGQPADIIAVKSGNAYLIDCKVCSNGKFAMSRIEANQELSMHLWRRRVGTNGWFAIKFDDRIYMIPHSVMISVRQSYLSEEDCAECGMKLQDWMLSAGMI